VQDPIKASLYGSIIDMRAEPKMEIVVFSPHVFRSSRQFIRRLLVDVRMSDVQDENESVLLRPVPDLVLETVVEHEELALPPPEHTG
jgi:hypothetical protein